MSDHTVRLPIPMVHGHVRALAREKTGIRHKASGAGKSNRRRFGVHFLHPAGAAVQDATRYFSCCLELALPLGSPHHRTAARVSLRTLPAGIRKKAASLARRGFSIGPGVFNAHVMGRSQYLPHPSGTGTSVRTAAR